jgi:hypothetical protein
MRYQNRFLILVVLCGTITLVAGCGGGDDPGPIVLGNEVFWHFDESSGATAFNSSFDDLHGNIVASQRGAGQVNNALSYSANLPSYVEFPAAISNIAISFPTDQISIEAWIKFETVDPILTYHFFGNADASGLERFIYRIKDGQFQFMLNPEDHGIADFELIKTNFDFGVDTWYHIAFNYDGSEANIYINGILNVQRPIVVSLHPYVNRLYLGGSPNVRSFPGFIDELRFLIGARSEAEIQTYFNSTK